MKTMILVAAMILAMAGTAAAQGDATPGSGATSTKTVIVADPETGKPRTAVVISEGTNPSITKTIEAP